MSLMVSMYSRSVSVFHFLKTRVDCRTSAAFAFSALSITAVNAAKTFRARNEPRLQRLQHDARYRKSRKARCHKNAAARSNSRHCSNLFRRGLGKSKKYSLLSCNACCRSCRAAVPVGRVAALSLLTNTAPSCRDDRQCDPEAHDRQGDLKPYKSAELSEGDLNSVAPGIRNSICRSLYSVCDVSQSPFDPFRMIIERGDDQ